MVTEIPFLVNAVSSVLKGPKSCYSILVLGLAKVKSLLNHHIFYASSVVAGYPMFGTHSSSDNIGKKAVILFSVMMLLFNQS